jgi:hypothetical protein
MVMHDLAGALLLALAGAAPIVMWRARFGHWRAGRVADLVDGERIKVGGTVEPLGPPLRAPFLDVECVAYSLWREDPAPPDESDYHKLAQDFILRDGAGDSVLVRGGERFNLHEGRRVLHAESNVDAQLIRAGDLVYVIGVATEVPDVEGIGATYREPPRRWMLGGSSDRPLVIVGRKLRGSR